MMKRKILAVTIPVVGCITVVGSGFSAWYFSGDITGEGSGSSEVNVVVTDEVNNVSNSNLTVSNTGKDLGKYLILDQGGPKNNSLDSGIMFGETVATETTENLNAKWHFTVTFAGDQNLTLDKIYDAGLQVRIAAEITLGGNLTDYVEFKKDSLSLTDLSDSDGPTIIMNKNKEGTKLQGEYIVADPNGENVQNAVWTFDMTAKTTKSGDNYSNELLKYITSSEKNVGTEDSPTMKPIGKPDATGEPEKMKNDLVETKANITFSVQAFIEDNPDK